MTTIAYKNGVIAADTATYFGTILVGECTKIARSPDGKVLGGGSGDAIYVTALLQWIRNGASGEPPLPVKDDDRDTTDVGIISYPDRLLRVESDGYYESGFDWMTCGSGYALAAMGLHLGLNPYEAVKEAMKLDAFTGGKVMVLRRM